MDETDRPSNPSKVIQQHTTEYVRPAISRQQPGIGSLAKGFRALLSFVEDKHRPQREDEQMIIISRS